MSIPCGYRFNKHWYTEKNLIEVIIKIMSYKYYVVNNHTGHYSKVDRFVVTHKYFSFFIFFISDSNL